MSVNTHGSAKAPPVSIDRTAVVSSNVVAIGYDPSSETLEIEFRPRADGTPAVYRYSPISVEQHRSIMEAPSIGRAVATLKYDPQVTCERVEVSA